MDPVKQRARLIAVRGPVLDIAVSGPLPPINHALVVDNGAGGLTAEVQAHISETAVRAIALQQTQGLARGAAVTLTGEPVTAPVGDATLGRMIDVTGNVSDSLDPLPADVPRLPIHRQPPAMAEQNAATQIFEITAFYSILIAFSLQLNAKEPSQTLVLVGGALTTCASLSPKNCEKNTQISGKTHNVFALSHTKISQIKQQWPSENSQAKNNTIKNLATMQAKSSPTLSKKELLWLWRDIDSKQLNSLSDQEYNFVIDMLEVAQIKSDNKRLKEQVNTALNSESAATEILQFISGSLKVNDTNPSMLAITASSRDPYESADFYEGLLSFPNVNSQWLALTPALAKAITTNKCDDLTTLRHSEMGLYQREHIYPDRTQAEYQLCKKGTDALVELIKNSTGVMFNGGDQSLTRKVLFDENNQPYPWTKALQSRLVIVGTSAGTAVQSGGQAHAGNVVMITNGTSLSALKEGAQAIDAPSERSNSDSLTYNRFGGLGTFSYGVLDTHFSERPTRPTFSPALIVSDSPSITPPFLP